MTIESPASQPPTVSNASRAVWSTTAQVALVYGVFGIGLAVALLGAERTQDLRLFRAINSIRLSMGLSIVALALFPFREWSGTLRTLWRLTWTFGFLAYLVHFLYAWLGVFGDQVPTAGQYPVAYGFPEKSHPTVAMLIIQHQGVFVFYSNLVVTVLWALDSLLAWTRSGGPALVRSGLVRHALAWLHVLISFEIATLVFGKNPVSTGLGYVLAGAAGVSLLVWIVCRLRPAPTVASA